MSTKLGDITLTKQTGTVLTLNTAGKYVNDDKYFDISVQQGAGTVTIASTDASIESDSSGRNISDSIGSKSSTAPSSGYYIKVDASGSGSSTVTTAGWLAEGSLGTASATGTFYFPIDSATVSQGTPTIDSTTGIVSATATATAGYTSAQSDTQTLQLSTKSAETYPFTTLASATIPAGKYLIGDQTILQAYTEGIEASNIKYGENIKVGDTESNGRIHNVTGTFTGSSTVSSGQTAATSTQIQSGYSAWVDGSEIQGTMPTATASISGTNTVTPSASISGTHVTLSNTDNGISVTSTGGGTASATATATSDTAGYVASSTQLDTQTIAASSSTTTASSFISGVTLTAPTSGTRQFSITVPNGNTTATFVFNVDSSGNVTITES